MIHFMSEPEIGSYKQKIYIYIILLTAKQSKTFDCKCVQLYNNKNLHFFIFVKEKKEFDSSNNTCTTKEPSHSLMKSLKFWFGNLLLWSGTVR